MSPFYIDVEWRQNIADKLKYFISCIARIFLPK